MKPALIAAIVLPFIIYLTPRGQGQQNAAKYQTETSHQLAPPGGQVHAQAEQATAQSKPPHWYKSPEWILVIVGAITAFVIGWQSWEARKAAEAARDHIRLQEIMSQQWLLVDGWRIEARDPATGIPIRFDVALEISNPTSANVTILSVSAIVNGIKHESRLENILAPTSEPYKVSLRVDLSKQEQELFKRYSFPLSVMGSISYRDARNRPASQPFGASCMCGPGIPQFTLFQDKRQNKSQT